VSVVMDRPGLWLIRLDDVEVGTISLTEEAQVLLGSPSAWLPPALTRAWSQIACGRGSLLDRRARQAGWVSFDEFAEACSESGHLCARLGVDGAAEAWASLLGDAARTGDIGNAPAMRASVEDLRRRVSQIQTNHQPGGDPS